MAASVHSSMDVDIGGLFLLGRWRVRFAIATTTFHRGFLFKGICSFVSFERVCYVLNITYSLTKNYLPYETDIKKQESY